MTTSGREQRQQLGAGAGSGRRRRSSQSSGLPSTRKSALMPTKAPADTNSPCEKLSVFVVVNVMLNPSATSA